MNKLVEKWRAEAAGCIDTRWENGYEVAMSKCADELEAALADEAVDAELPPLPECWSGAPVSVTWAEDGETTTREVFTAEQMHAYAKSAIAMEKK